MRLYSGTSVDFISDSVHNRIAEKLRDAFFHYFRYNPSPAEVGSWRNSLRAMAQVIEFAGLKDHGILLEYQLPQTSKRLDCLVAGKGEASRDHAVIVELKQWERSAPADGENEVLTWVGGSEREVLHPSVQVGQYSRYLQDNHTAFHSGDSPVGVTGCAYLHNYAIKSEDPLLSQKFAGTLSEFPLFSERDVDSLADYLGSRLSHGGGTEVLRRIEASEYAPSKKLLEHVAKLIRGNPVYTLLDEQLVVFDKVLALARAGLATAQKSVVLVRGGPGTGKSVIAINLMAALLEEGLNAQYATGSRAFTETLRKIIGSRGSAQFKYFNSYTDIQPNAIDVLVADESHRIRSTSASRFTPKSERSDQPQILELLEAARLGVYFVDDHQVVRPNEIGSADYIRSHAIDQGCKVWEYELEAQFRCSGSDAFISWVNNTLGIRRTANVLWDQHEEFEFRIYDDPMSLEIAIRERSAQGHTARVVAGFCWDWSMPDENGFLLDDVVIGDYKRPWDAKYEAKKLAPGIPKASLWAYDPNGINQIGCVYTAQGFEFDYVGVIFGPDLVYDPKLGEWRGVPTKSADRMVKRAKEGFVGLVKNTYRVLLSRGMRGCYVHFMDPDTRNFFKSRME